MAESNARGAYGAGKHNGEAYEPHDVESGEPHVVQAEEQCHQSGNAGCMSTDFPEEVNHSSHNNRSDGAPHESGEP